MVRMKWLRFVCPATTSLCQKQQQSEVTNNKMSSVAVLSNLSVAATLDPPFVYACTRVSHTPAGASDALQALRLMHKPYDASA